MLGVSYKKYLINIILLAGTIILGFVITYQFATGQEENQLTDSWSYVPDLAFLDIFLSNLLVSFLLLTGMFVFGITTVIVMSVNGFWIGVIWALFYIPDQSILKIMSAMLPHGIIEFSAFLIAGSIGMTKFKNLKKKNIIKNVTIIVGLLLLAALVEITFSLSIVESFT